ncbi:MAG: hypothetical protein JW841_15620 [Deltaproteobacteria bacterium]|nr:hypothetical protein [Deltaproteobacteria bacterium]
MLSIKKQATLPLPKFDAATMAEFAHRNYLWTPIKHDGLEALWLSAPDFISAGKLPPKGSDGFVPLAGFAHVKYPAVVGLRYSKAAFDFIPTDFLEIADTRSVSQSSQYILDGTIVAEHAGQLPDGNLFCAALHRRSAHVFFITAQWPHEVANELMAPMTAFNAGLVIKSPAHQPVEKWVLAKPSNQPISFYYNDKSKLQETDDSIIITNHYSQSHNGEFVIQSPPIACAKTAEQLLTKLTIDFHKRIGKPQQVSVRTKKIELAQEQISIQAQVRTCSLADGREVTLAVLPLSTTYVTLTANYPGAAQLANGWMAARFAIRQLIATCKLK